MNLEELEALYEKATKGEWNARCFPAGNSVVDAGVWTAYFETVPGNVTSEERAASAEFVAAFHNQFPALAARLRALERVAQAAARVKVHLPRDAKLALEDALKEVS